MELLRYITSLIIYCVIGLGVHLLMYGDVVWADAFTYVAMFLWPFLLLWELIALLFIVVMIIVVVGTLIFLLEKFK